MAQGCCLALHIFFFFLLLLGMASKAVEKDMLIAARQEWWMSKPSHQGLCMCAKCKKADPRHLLLRENFVTRQTATNHWGAASARPEQFFHSSGMLVPMCKDFAKGECTIDGEYQVARQHFQGGLLVEGEGERGRERRRTEQRNNSGPAPRREP
jgi:hypothetical protein